MEQTNFENPFSMSFELEMEKSRADQLVGQGQVGPNVLGRPACGTDQKQVDFFAIQIVFYFKGKF